MNADFYRLGKKFKHKQGYIITVIEEDGTKYFENENGDLFSYIEDELILCEVNNSYFKNKD